MTTPLTIPEQTDTATIKDLSIAVGRANPARAALALAGNPDAPMTANAPTLDQYERDIHGNVMVTDPIEKSNNFKSWFRNSKVRNQDGSPVKMFHGSPKFVGNQLDPNKRGNRDDGHLGRGFYFSQKKQMASEYAETPIFDIYGETVVDTTAPEVMEVFLSVQNPVVLDAEGGLDNKTWNAFKKHISKTFAGHPDDRWKESIKSGDIEPNLRFDALTEFEIWYNYGVSEMAEDAGFDAIMLDDMREVNIFNPTQAKSVRNRGWFNPDNPDLMSQTKKKKKTKPV
tara:strand:- start:3825 stop:4676 length:852 start_codon:yes stop_codon:yes gene_type:complete